MITAHCIVRNEEIYIEPAIMSVINFVDKIIVFDTGSTDLTVSIIKEIDVKYPQKIVFEQKGKSNPAEHTNLRQEMIDKTTTEWFFILDGDEVWTDRAMREVVNVMRQKEIECIIAPFHLCVGDVYHETKKEGGINILGVKGFHYPRFIKKIDGVHWKGDYGEDCLYNKDGHVFFKKENTYFLEHKYWHMTHLLRSQSGGQDYSSGGIREDKLRLTYLFLGKRINEALPEVFANYSQGVARLNMSKAIIGFFELLYSRLCTVIKK